LTVLNRVGLVFPSRHSLYRGLSPQCFKSRSQQSALTTEQIYTHELKTLYKPSLEWALRCYTYAW